MNLILQPARFRHSYPHQRTSGLTRWPTRSHDVTGGGARPTRTQLPNTSGLPAWLYAQLTSADEPLLSVANTVAACVFGKRPGLWVSRFLREAVPVIRLSLAEGACGVWRWLWPGFVRGAPARASRGTVALPGAGSTCSSALAGMLAGSAMMTRGVRCWGRWMIPGGTRGGEWAGMAARGISG